MRKYLITSVFSVATIISVSAYADLMINPFPNEPAQAVSEAPAEVVAPLPLAIQDSVNAAPEAPVVTKTIVEPPRGLSSFDIEKYYATFGNAMPAPAIVMPAPAPVEPRIETSYAPAKTRIEYVRDPSDEQRIRELEKSLNELQTLKTKTRDLEQDNQVLKSELMSMKANEANAKPRVVAASMPVDEYYARFAKPAANQPAENMTPAPIVASTQSNAPQAIETASGGLSRAADRPVRKSWQAAQGHSVRQILAAWSQQEGVEFFWATEDDFSVLKPISATTSYESAVENLLGQYMDKEQRPVGSLHIDPQTGTRALVVQGLI